jgi:hypothetical protein
MTYIYKPTRIPSVIRRKSDFSSIIHHFHNFEVEVEVVVGRGSKYVAGSSAIS